MFYNFYSPYGQQPQGQVGTDFDHPDAQEWQAWEDNVIIHEQAHAAVGGAYAGAPQYDYELKDDGQYYIVGGRVSIDMSYDEAQPEEMLAKMDTVYRAAMAPSDPSGEDYKIAGEAQAHMMQANSLILQKYQQPSASQSGANNPFGISALDGLPLF